MQSRFFRKSHQIVTSVKPAARRAKQVVFSRALCYNAVIEDPFRRFACKILRSGGGKDESIMKHPKAIRTLCALVLAAALLLSSLPALSTGDQGNLYMYVSTGNSGRLHLRALPTTASASLGLYPNGTAVLVESISSNWALVQAGGQRGYMLLTCLSSVSPYNPIVNPSPVPTEDTTLYVRTGNTGKLHLREYASRNARSLGLYPNGTAVHVTSRSGGWAYVNIGGVTGYMMLQYLTATSPLPPAPQPPVTPDPTGGPVTPTAMFVSTGNSGRLHLREYPSLSARSLGLYPNGTLVYAVNLNNGWCQVTVGAQSGFMMAVFLTAATPTVPTPAPTAEPTAAPVPAPTGATLMYVRTGNSGRLHLRSNISTSSASLGLFANGTPVYVIANYGAWAYVNVLGQAGYMMTQFLSAADPGAAPTAVPPPTPLPAAATVRQPNGSFVYLRSSRNSNGTANVLAQVPSGSVVDVLEWGEFWSRIRYNGQEGYMVTHYLK